VNMRELSAVDAAAAMLDESVTPNLPEDGSVAAVEGEKKI
jgi:histidine ammonia-lyase